MHCIVLKHHSIQSFMSKTMGIINLSLHISITAHVTNLFPEMRSIIQHKDSIEHAFPALYLKFWHYSLWNTTKEKNKTSFSFCSTLRGGLWGEQADKTAKSQWRQRLVCKANGSLCLLWNRDFSNRIRGTTAQMSTMQFKAWRKTQSAMCDITRVSGHNTSKDVQM